MDLTDFPPLDHRAFKIKSNIKKMLAAMVTTAREVPAGTDIELLMKVWEAVQF
jgi:hypothetical protein